MLNGNQYSIKPRLTVAVALLVSALLAAAAPAAHSSLPAVEEVFPLQVERVGEERLVATWRIDADHYLYRHALDFTLDDGDNEIVATVLPEAEQIHDDFYGDVEIYRGLLQVHLETAAPLSADAVLRVDFQGCNEPRALCYPPTTVEIEGGAVTAITTGGRLDPPGGGDPLTNLLAGGNLWAVLGGFFIAGLALAFTACLYPMIPILSGLIVGAHGSGRPGTGRALWLSLLYVQAMAVTYAAAGALAGLSGRAIQASLQGPAVSLAFSALFVLLALAMFGLYNLQMPAAVQSRLQAASSRLPGGQEIGVVAMGVVSTLIVGACSGPALVAALVFISNTGEVALGAGALYVMALGMGMPLLLVGTAAGRWMPRSGTWMGAVKQAFGFVFLGLAWWMAARLLPSAAELAGWGALLVAAALWLAWQLLAGGAAGAGGCARTDAGACGGGGGGGNGGTPRRRWPRWVGGTLAVLIAAGGVLQWVGAASGASSPLRPWAALTGDDRAALRERVLAEWRTVDGGIEALERALAAAAEQGRPAVVDISAEWCVYCAQLETYTFPERRVRQALSGVEKLRVDVTAMSGEDREILEEYGLYLPPAVLFFTADGEEQRAQRVVGFEDADAFLERLRAAFER